MKTFIQDALRTESKPEFDPMGINLATCNKLISTIFEVIEVNKRLDHLKKVIFYGAKSGDENVTLHTAVSASTYRLLHAAMGASTESAEMLEALVDVIADGQDVDKVNLIEEGGDVMWYLAILFDELDTSFEEAGNTVVNKLRVRYPDKFTSKDALDRDLISEREVLEQSGNK